jgi:hypothetical protein
MQRAPDQTPVAIEVKIRYTSAQAGSRESVAAAASATGQLPVWA